MIQEIELVASPKGQAEGVQIVKRKNVLEFYFYSRTSIFYIYEGKATPFAEMTLIYHHIKCQ